MAQTTISGGQPSTETLTGYRFEAAECAPSWFNARELEQRVSTQILDAVAQLPSYVVVGFGFACDFPNDPVAIGVRRERGNRFRLLSLDRVTVENLASASRTEHLALVIARRLREATRGRRSRSAEMPSSGTVAETRGQADAQRARRSRIPLARDRAQMLTPAR